MKRKKIYITILIIIIIILLLSYVGINYIDNINATPTDIFYNNEEKFESVVDELSGDSIIEIEEKFTFFKITHDYKNEKKIYKNSDTYIKYENSINLIKELNLEFILKNHKNIQFTLNSNMRTSEKIVYITDMEKYKNGHIISEISQIKGNWYYTIEK